MRAALYGRYSTDKQSVASVDDQLRICERIAEGHRFTVVARFSDAAVSGGTAERPGYQAMLKAARNGEFDVIVAEDTSRLWRNLAEQASRIAELADMRPAPVQVVTNDLDTRSESAGILGAVLGASAEAYRREIARRTRRGLEGNALAGKPTGGRAYGFTAARDSATGQIEINATEAAVVRRIFELYADGWSPRSIAAKLNEEGVASPGSKWKRTARRHDGKWLASAIHGDVNRGSGILNNRRYLGVISWGRAEWKRSAVDSKVRRYRMLEAGSSHERVEESLRIVSQELWDRVKARQALASNTGGAKVKAALQRRRSGGPPAKYLLSGLLVCGACESNFVLTNGTRYQCASHHNGGAAACPVSLSVPRERVEAVVMQCIEGDLLDVKRLSEIEERYADAQRGAGIKVDVGPRLQQLQTEIRNIGDAIAKGLVSEALAARLQAAEAERARLLALQEKPVSAPRRLAVATIERRVEMMKRRLREGGDLARSALQEIIPDRISLVADPAEGFLWACFADGTGTSLLGAPRDWAAAFSQVPDSAQVGNNGSGGRI